MGSLMLIIQIHSDKEGNWFFVLCQVVNQQRMAIPKNLLVYSVLQRVTFLIPSQVGPVSKYPAEACLFVGGSTLCKYCSRW